MSIVFENLDNENITNLMKNIKSKISNGIKDNLENLEIKNIEKK